MWISTWKGNRDVSYWDYPIPWIVFSIIAGVIFYSRFYLQWIASEAKRESVVPDFFWYQSIVGSLMLMVWSIKDQSPLGALSQSLNVVPYSRNVVHILRAKGRLTRTRHIVLNTAPVLVALFACFVVAYIWWQEFEHTQTMETQEAQRTWLLLAVGVTGQALFGVRFFVQWAVTERQKKSVVPLSFWYISVAATVLTLPSYLQRHEWIFLIGQISNLLVYLRNIWLVRRKGEAAAVLAAK